jgi:ribosomal protein S18 acetylase RimI-like enzyme
MDEYSVTIREWSPTDVPFIYSTWRNAIYYGWCDKTNGLRPSQKDFFRAQTKYIDDVLESADVKMAALDGNTIVGYVIYKDEHLYFIYVKEAYRREGVGKLLCPEFKTVSGQLTKVGAAILKKRGIEIE